MKLDRWQIRRIAYDASCAMYRTMGVGAVTEWSSLPESTRMETDITAPEVKYRPELKPLSDAIVSAVVEALEQYPG